MSAANSAPPGAGARPASPAKMKQATLNLLLVLRRNWLAKRGVPLPPPALTAQQRAEIEECFQMLDADGSGAIDVDEIIEAFGALGFEIDKAAIEVRVVPASSGTRKCRHVGFSPVASVVAGRCTATGVRQRSGRLPSGLACHWLGLRRWASGLH